MQKAANQVQNSDQEVSCSSTFPFSSSGVSSFFRAVKSDSGVSNVTLSLTATIPQICGMIERANHLLKMAY